MPKSDTWPGGIGLETMTGMDSAGSCDSVVSANSGFSDDSLEHLSAEEKACLMFLEETIESLDTEEDSGLSNDEPDQLPCPGSLATKLAVLSASMSKSKLDGFQKHASKEPTKKSVDTKPLQSYLVPTPFVMASSSPCSVPTAKPSVPPDKNLRARSHFTPSSKEPGQVNDVMPPPTKPRDTSGRAAEAPLPRGPLSYEALVHLRRSASTKKTPLCPTVDHTIDLDKHRPVKVDRSNSEASLSRPGPPAVLPKPKMIPANIPVKTQNEAFVTSDSSHSVKHSTDPQAVRLEALQKLGLLKENETVAPQSAPNKSLSSLDPTPNRLTRGPANVNTSRSPSFCYSQVQTEPKNRPLQSSASFHHYSRNDQQPVSASHPAQFSGLKAVGQEHAATLSNHRNCGQHPEPRHVASAKPMNSSTAAQPAPHKPSNSVGYTVMMVPGMGADRKEALRKLGLLKD